MGCASSVPEPATPLDPELVRRVYFASADAELHADCDFGEPEVMVLDVRATSPSSTNSRQQHTPLASAEYGGGSSVAATGPPTTGGLGTFGPADKEGGIETEEPSDLAKAISRRRQVALARIRHGINEDIAQFPVMPPPSTSVAAATQRVRSWFRANDAAAVRELELLNGSASADGATAATTVTQSPANHPFVRHGSANYNHTRSSPSTTNAGQQQSPRSRASSFVRVNTTVGVATILGPPTLASSLVSPPGAVPEPTPRGGEAVPFDEGLPTAAVANSGSPSTTPRLAQRPSGQNLIHRPPLPFVSPREGASPRSASTFGAHDAGSGSVHSAASFGTPIGARSRAGSVASSVDSRHSLHQQSSQLALRLTARALYRHQVRLRQVGVPFAGDIRLDAPSFSSDDDDDDTDEERRFQRGGYADDEG